MRRHRLMGVSPFAVAVMGGGAVAYDQLLKNIYGSTMIQHLSGGEASGSVATDISQNAINGAYAGTPVFGAAGLGDGKTFVNFNAAGEIDNDAAALIALWSGDAGFMSCWAGINDTASWANANIYNLGYYGASATYYYQMRKQIDGGFVFLSRRSGTIKDISSLPPTTTRLCHYHLTWDTANDRIVAYINGTKQKPTTTLSTWSGALAADYGRWGDSSPQVGNVTWPGRMGKMILGNAVPTDAQVAQASQSVGQVVFDGDSRSNIKPWTNSSVELAFPTGDFAFGKYGYACWAVSGDGIDNLIARQATTNALVRPGKNILVVWVGVNDNTGKTAQQIYDKIVIYCNAARAAGWNKIVLNTEIDASPVGWTAKYQALNVLIAADHSFVDGVADLGARAELQDNTNETYYLAADHLHLTAAGYAVVRDVVAPVIAAVAA